MANLLDRPARGGCRRHPQCGTPGIVRRVERVCERCAGEDDDLVLVRAPAATAGDVPGGPELWCFECRSTADHVALDEG